MRVLEEMRNVLKTQILRDKCIEIPYAGKFLLVDETTIRFMPSLELLTSGRFQFTENENNVSPFSKTSARFYNSQKISLSRISLLCGIDAETSVRYIKNEFLRFVKQSR